MGEYKSMKTGPMSVEFVYKGDAEYVLKNRKYLGERIFVDKEYCVETEECKKVLRPYLKAACKLPKYHRKCKLKGGELILRGVTYTKDHIHKLPEELSSYRISSKQDEEGTIIAFYGNMNPFSNFHPA